MLPLSSVSVTHYLIFYLLPFLICLSVSLSICLPTPPFKPCGSIQLPSTRTGPSKPYHSQYIKKLLTCLRELQDGWRKGPGEQAPTQCFGCGACMDFALKAVQRARCKAEPRGQYLSIWKRLSVEGFRQDPIMETQRSAPH